MPGDPVTLECDPVALHPNHITLECDPVALHPNHVTLECDPVALRDECGAVSGYRKRGMHRH